MKKLFYLFFALLFINQQITAQVPSYVPTDGLVGYWPFDGNANDASGNGNNGVVNGPLLTSDRFGNNNSAFSFTVNSSAGWGSAQDRITVTNPTIPNDNSFAMSGWVNLESKPSPYNNRAQTLMGRWDINGTIIFRNQINYTGQIFTTLADDGLNESVYSSGNVSYGNWEHVVITYDGSVLKHYKNGQLTGQETLNININTDSSNLTFGEVHMENGHWLLFSGKMDDLGYWSRALTQQEVTNLYNSETTAQVPSYVPTDGLVGYWPFDGNANDASGNGNNGVVNGPLLTSDRFGNNNSAFSFTVNSSAGWGSAQDRITVTNPTIPNDNSFAMSGWVNLESKPSPYNNRAQTLMGRWDINGTIIFRNQINYTGQIFTTLADDGLNESVYSSGNVSYGNWEHVVITYDGSVLKHYKNGQLTGQETLNININTDSSNLTFGEVHMENGHWLLFSGKMDDLGYWSRALTQTEITDLYDSDFLSTNTAINESNVNIYPNPANDQITIDCGNLHNVEGWNIKITNVLGQEVFSQPMNTQQYVIPLNTWTGQGVYFVKIINAENEVVNFKKIILQ